MICGSVVAVDDPPLTGKPVISIAVTNPSEQQTAMAFDVTVDTGFTGFLTLEPITIARLRLPFIANRPAVLASGEVEPFNVHAGRILWHSQERLVPIYSVDSDPRVGMALLWNSRLTVDVVADGSVDIVPLAS